MSRSKRSVKSPWRTLCCFCSVTPTCRYLMCSLTTLMRGYQELPYFQRGLSGRERSSPLTTRCKVSDIDWAVLTSKIQYPTFTFCIVSKSSQSSLLTHNCAQFLDTFASNNFYWSIFKRPFFDWSQDCNVYEGCAALFYLFVMSMAYEVVCGRVVGAQRGLWGLWGLTLPPVSSTCNRKSQPGYPLTTP